MSHKVRVGDKRTLMLFSRDRDVNLYLPSAFLLARMLTPSRDTCSSGALSLVYNPAGECFPGILYAAKADAQQPGVGHDLICASITEQGVGNWLFPVKEPASGAGEAGFQTPWEECERVLSSQKGRRAQM